MPGLSSPKRGALGNTCRDRRPGHRHDLDSRSEGCDSKRSGDVFKAGGAELLKVILHQRPLDPSSCQAAAIRAASPNSSEAGEPDSAPFMIFPLIAPREWAVGARRA
jgi:hypothetical protein